MDEWDGSPRWLPLRRTGSIGDYVYRSFMGNGTEETKRRKGAVETGGRFEGHRSLNSEGFEGLEEGGGVDASSGVVL